MEISGSLMSAGLQTMQASQQKVAEAAQGIASNNTGNNDIAELTTQLVQMEQAENMSQAGAKMVQTADEALGTIINTTAYPYK